MRKILIGSFVGFVIGYGMGMKSNKVSEYIRKRLKKK